MIRAECHSDDFKMTAKFDATPWFDTATEDEIVQLSRQEWGGDYGADAVAQALQDTPGYKQLEAVFNYLGNRPKTPSGETIGFEVHIHAPDALRWLRMNRREIFDEVAVVEGIDAGAEKKLEAPATSPHWEKDSSWTAKSYDVEEPTVPKSMLDAPETVLEFLAAEVRLSEKGDLTLVEALGNLQQMDQSVLNELNDYFRTNKPDVMEVTRDLEEAIVKYGFVTHVRDRLDQDRLAGPAKSPAMR